MKNNKRNYSNNYNSDYRRNDSRNRNEGPKISGIAVEVKNGQFERAMRKFKKKVTEAGILQEVKERRFFVKPSEVKRKARDAGKKRWKRKQKMSEWD
ncbi:MAG: 30S ribosomal protein S21 [Candidatus Endolissoclinum sp. TMED37]|nr:MAG: 30S ribosomal protein S21 [Candidatus Endolissoclinum sp. TMED37]|tara:strand:- start:1207 stop:1497 length:291 start_codon:yes stop_codon:yes gene_type:complete